MTKDEESFLILHMLMHPIVKIAFIDEETLKKVQERIHREFTLAPNLRRLLIEVTQAAHEELN